MSVEQSQAMTTARSVQRTYLLLMLGNTLAASFIWGINTIFLLDAGLSTLEAFAANAFFTAGMVLFEVPTGVVAWGTRSSPGHYRHGSWTRSPRPASPARWSRCSGGARPSPARRCSPARSRAASSPSRQPRRPVRASRRRPRADVRGRVQADARHRVHPGRERAAPSVDAPGRRRLA